MLYLGIDQHKSQLTVKLRSEDGSVILKRQVNTQWEKVRFGVPGTLVAPFFAEVDPPRITSTSLADGPPQAVFGLGRRNQMDVIGHQAIAPNLDAPFAAPVGHQFDIRRIVSIVEKSLLAAVATLRDMVRQTRDDQSC
jgi:hypothetical protein